MNKKLISVLSVLILTAVLNIPVSYAEDKVAEPNPVIAGASSLVLPPVGQIENKEGTKPKSFIMGAVEACGITALVLTATLVGGPIVWVGIGPLMANHIWSGTEAYATAKRKSEESAKVTTPVPAPVQAQTEPDKKKSEENQSVVK
ncbi:MAG: hypothetical protein HZC17_07080 [Candidatus Omnitrophica bacterium]|nr:hypothetical protein [Candidatus Omnitrophota bacterium]